jgi:hypothetical protein
VKRRPSRDGAAARRAGRSAGGRGTGPGVRENSPTGKRWGLRLARNLLLWAAPAVLAWMAVTPYYNLFLANAGQSASRLTERPAVTRVDLSRGHEAVISRTDTRAGGHLPYRLRLTDVHFPLVLLLVLFLAVPDVPWRERLANLGYALLITVVFHVLDVFFWVKFVYATQLGEWSLRQYGPFARNFWGMGKHLLDLPVKLALPLLLWAWFYLGQLRALPFNDLDRHDI